MDATTENKFWENLVSLSQCVRRYLRNKVSSQRTVWKVVDDQKQYDYTV